ncbi:Denticleless protein-like protein [Bienertia sinuspersici]
MLNSKIFPPFSSLTAQLPTHNKQQLKKTANISPLSFPPFLFACNFHSTLSKPQYSSASMEIYNSKSILHDINLRELHGFKGRKRPLFTYSTSIDERNNEPSCSRGVSSSHYESLLLPWLFPLLSVNLIFTIKNAHILAVTDEEGYVNFLDTRLKLDSSATHQENAAKSIVSSWVAHDNSVYDLCWTKEDRSVLTASADHTIKLWDVEHKKCYGMLRGHVGSVKSVSCHPTNSDLVVSGSRDGSFALWDLRCNPQRGRDWITPNEQVNGAHTSAKRKRFIKKKVCIVINRIIWSLLMDYVLLIDISFFHVVKLWDTRNLRVSAAQACPLQESTTEMHWRHHGITSLSQDCNGVLLSASCTDNRIYLYNVLQLQKGPISSFSGCQIGSFYIKSTISPDASHILSGSSDGNGYIWQVENPDQDPISLTKHEKEVTAVDWCLHEPGKIATASDDNTRESPCISSHDEAVMQEQSLGELMKTPETTPNLFCRNRLLQGVNLNEAFNKTPESAVLSPSSVLTPPSSMKKRTIRDYFMLLFYLLFCLLRAPVAVLFAAAAVAVLFAAGCCCPVVAMAVVSPLAVAAGGFRQLVPVVVGSWRLLLGNCYEQSATQT